MATRKVQYRFAVIFFEFIAAIEDIKKTSTYDDVLVEGGMGNEVGIGCNGES